MKVTLTAQQWAVIAGVFDEDVIPSKGAIYRKHMRLYDWLSDWRKELEGHKVDEEIEHELPASYCEYLRGRLSDTKIHQYRTDAWIKFILPTLRVLGWNEPIADDETE